MSNHCGKCVCRPVKSLRAFGDPGNLAVGTGEITAQRRNENDVVQQPWAGLAGSDALQEGDVEQVAFVGRGMAVLPQEIMVGRT